jgi:DNA-binding GntR family transcriptional regulator
MQNQELCVNPVSAKNLAVISEPTYKPDLVRRLLLTAFSGEWQAGDRLPEVELAQRFGVSRTPVREALQELAAIGLIELRPNCGAVARSCGPQQVREIYEVREILESEATRLACGRIEPRKIENLISEFKELLAESRRSASWSHREWEADRQLHDLIAQACGNCRLAEEISRYGKLIQVIRETVGNLREAQVAAVSEHLAILKALRSELRDAAADAMRAHLRSAADYAVEALSP